MKTLYKFHQDWTDGTLYGLFIEEKGNLEELVKSEKEIYFGEVLGKHSEIIGIVTADDYTEVTSDPLIIKTVEDLGLEFGYNPFDYLVE